MACVVEDCKSHSTRKENTNENVSFHKFPKDEIMKNAWIRRLSRFNWTPTIHSRIFSNHFASESFIMLNKSVRWRRLKANAVPTLHLPEATNSMTAVPAPLNEEEAGDMELNNINPTPPVFHFEAPHLKSGTAILRPQEQVMVVLNVGLCIALFDITHIGHSYIFPGDGSSHTEVIFRYIVFRPIVEEILIGKIRSCSREGVHVTLGFFDDILIPVNALQHPSRFDETDQAWVWEYPKEDGEKHDLFMDSGESIRFRVTSEAFEESLPSGPPGSECPGQTVAPYKLVGGINEPGLGLLTWWEAPEQDDGDDNEEQENDD